MKQEYEATLEENFNRALELCSQSYDYENLITFLKDGNIAEKQYAALVIAELKSSDDAYIFISNLINCDGKIREAVAQKITEFVKNDEYRKYFSVYPDIFAKSTIDINANISRMIVDSLYFLMDFEQFGRKYSQILLNFIEDAFDGLDKIIYRDKKYTINKQLFKLYWAIEGLYNYSQYVDNKTLHNILERAFGISEYTVREKAAKLLSKYSDVEPFCDLMVKVENDDNYYVKNAKM